MNTKRVSTMAIMQAVKDKYRYSLFPNPNEIDPCLESQKDAEKKAYEMSIANNGAPVAVYDENEVTLKLFAGYESFVPAK